MRRFIHFVDNEKLPKSKDDPKWDPLQKVAPFLMAVQTNLQRAWNLGEKICVDESMIKYLGRAIAWVQYMPAKPIKHGIKVFALCCAHTGFLFAFEIHTGKANGLDSLPSAVIMRLLAAADGSQGRILHTDNFCTHLEVMKAVHLHCKMLMVGTRKLTKKKSRTKSDFPFAKLADASLKKLNMDG